MRVLMRKKQARFTPDASQSTSLNASPNLTAPGDPCVYFFEYDRSAYRSGWSAQTALAAGPRRLVRSDCTRGWPAQTPAGPLRLHSRLARADALHSRLARADSHRDGPAQTHIEAGPLRSACPRRSTAAGPLELQSDSRLQTADSTLQTANSRTQTADSRLPAPDCTLQTADPRPQAANSRLQTADSRLLTPDCRLQTADSRLQTPDSRLQTPDSRLPTADCRLQTRLQTADCRLPGSRTQTPQTADSRLQTPDCRLHTTRPG